MRPPPLNLLGLAPLARPPRWCQLPPTLGCPSGPGGVSTDLQTVLVETSKASLAAHEEEDKRFELEGLFQTPRLPLACEAACVPYFWRLRAFSPIAWALNPDR